MTEHEPSAEIESSPEHEAVGSWFGRAVGILLRLVLVIVLGIALGVGLYLGVPALIEAWTEPIEANRAQIAELELEVSRLREQQQETIGGLSDRVARLEGQNTELSERASELESQVASLEEDLAEAEGRIDRVMASQSQLEIMELELSELQLQVEQLLENQQEPGSELSALEAKIQQLRAMILISRARFELVRDNYGLASENLEAALAVFDAQPMPADSWQAAVVERLELADEALPDSPAVAAQDLEAAWRLLNEQASEQDEIFN
ncbi:MAG: hypothetical protein ACLFWD_03250 [Anaerolineales bacterium]